MASQKFRLTTEDIAPRVGVAAVAGAGSLVALTVLLMSNFSPASVDTPEEVAIWTSALSFVYSWLGGIIARFTTDTTGNAGSNQKKTDDR